MKEIKFILLFLLVSNQLFSQNCEISNGLSYRYNLSAISFVHTNVANDPQHSYYDSIHFPQHEINEFLYWISAIFEQSGTEEFNEIFEESNWELGGEKYSRPFDFIIEAPLNSVFMDTLNVSRTHSGLLQLDSLIDLYDLNLKEVKDLSNSTIATFTATGIVYRNLRPLFEQIQEINSVTYSLVSFQNSGNCYGDIDVVKTFYGDTVTLKMLEKIDTSSTVSYWTYFINNDCEIELIDKEFNSCKNTVGINEIENTLSIYPNPVSDFLFVKSSNTKFNQIKIYNILGEALEFELAFTNNLLKIDLSGFNSGIYFLQTNTKITKFIKE